MKEKMAGLLKPEELVKYALDGKEDAFTEAIQKSSGKIPKSGLLSVKGKKTEEETGKSENGTASEAKEKKRPKGQKGKPGKGKKVKA